MTRRAWLLLPSSLFASRPTSEKAVRRAFREAYRAHNEALREMGLRWNEVVPKWENGQYDVPLATRWLAVKRTGKELLELGDKAVKSLNRDM